MTAPGTAVSWTRRGVGALSVAPMAVPAVFGYSRRHGSARAGSAPLWLLLGLALAGPTGCAAGKAAKAPPAPRTAGVFSGSSGTPQPGQLDQLFPEVQTAAAALSLGDQSLREGKQDLALVYYLRAYDLQQSNIEALERLAALYARKGEDRSAELAYQSILKLNPAHAGANESLGLMRLDHRGYADAEKLLGKAVAAEPGRWRSWNGLGIVADMQGNHPRALAAYRTALKAAPASPVLVGNIGYSYYLAGDRVHARQFLIEALAIDAKYARAARNLGLLEARERNYQAAVGLLSRVMEPHAAYNNVGYLCMIQGDYPEAEHFLSESVRLSPIYYERAHENIKQLRLLEERR